MAVTATGNVLSSAAAVPVLSADLYEAIVDAMAPETLLGTALRLNKLFDGLCTSQTLWQAVCERRWPGGVPPSDDYRLHAARSTATPRHQTREAQPPGACTSWSRSPARTVLRSGRAYRSETRRWSRGETGGEAGATR